MGALSCNAIFEFEIVGLIGSCASDINNSSFKIHFHRHLCEGNLERNFAIEKCVFAERKKNSEHVKMPLKIEFTQSEQVGEGKYSQLVDIYCVE